MAFDYLDAKNQIYIPGILIIVGCALTKPVWLPYALVLAAGLVWMKFSQFRILKLKQRLTGRTTTSPQTRRITRV
jgi:hypothetical protein